jgi:hypothetical protein
VPANKTWLIDQFTISLGKRLATNAQFVVQLRPFSTQTWQTILEGSVDSTGTSEQDLSPPEGRPLAIPEKTDVRVRVLSVGANDTNIYINSAGLLVNKLGRNLK